MSASDEFFDHSRYGFCSGCGWRNNLADLQGQIKIIREEINADHVTLAEAVKKIVSVFAITFRMGS